MHVRYLLSLLVAMAGLWLLLSGLYKPMLLGLGAASCVVVVALCRRMGIADAESLPLRQLHTLPLYWLWLLKEIAKSNLDVAMRILRPGRHIAPTMVRLRAHQSSELGQVIFANSITLTPGTLTVHLTDGIAEVHALTRESAQEIEGGEMDRRVRALEGDREQIANDKGA